MSSPAYLVRSRVPRIAGAAVERARLSVVPRTRVRAARVPFVTLVSVILLGGVVGLLLFNTSMQQSSFAATTLEERAAALSARQQTLEMEIEDLRNPQHVAALAQQLGMVLPQGSRTVTLGSGTITGVGEPATADGRVRLNGKAPRRPADLDPAAQVVKVRPPEGVLPATAGPGGRPVGTGSGDTSANGAREGRAQGRNASQQ